MPSIMSCLTHQPLSPQIHWAKGGRPLQLMIFFLLFSKRPQELQGGKENQPAQGCQISDQKTAERTFKHKDFLFHHLLFVFQVSIKSILPLLLGFDAFASFWGFFVVVFFGFYKMHYESGLNYNGNENILEKHFRRTGSECWFALSLKMFHKCPPFKSEGHFSLFMNVLKKPENRLCFWKLLIYRTFFILLQLFKAAFGNIWPLGLVQFYCWRISNQLSVGYIISRQRTTCASRWSVYRDVR